MIECTTFRTEQGYSDGRRPDLVEYAATIEEDLSRRDFTMNSIAVSLPDGTIIDPFGGRADIRAGIIRTVGRPEERFAEDGLRPLRGVRFSAQLGFSIDDKTLAAIPGAIPVTAKVACERVREELSKILVAPVPSVGLRFMEQTGLLGLIIPELAACRGVEQKGMHRFDVLDHLLAACDACPAENLELRLAGLFHDIGKPVVRADDGTGSYTFHNHEAASARLADTIMTRLRYPQKTCKMVDHLVKQHMFHYEPQWTDAAVRRFIVRVGPENIENLFILRRADSHAITGIAPDPRLLAEFSDRIQKVLDADHAFSLKDLAVNGKDLLAQGIPAGPETGHILQELFETVLDDPALNSRNRLLEIALEIHMRKFA
jgi:poly(A) polymerase/tRNA nucleotidyltransferase (CCA-adding enzyme)